MSATLETAKRWACDRCGVSISQMTGEHTELPENWVSSDEGQFCLNCRRERAGEAALASIPDDASHAERAQLRRNALLEFEVQRDPDRTNGEIARACRATAPAIAETRRRLGLPEADPALSAGKTQPKTRRRR